MEFKKIFSKTSLYTFCIVMILFFYTSLVYPEQTNYWLVTNGIQIIILEFISIFTTLLLLVITNEEAGKMLSVQTSGLLSNKISKKNGYLITFIAVIISALFFSLFFNIWLFIYFLISNAVKYLSFKQIGTSVHTNNAIKSLKITMNSMILSVIIAFFGSFILYAVFPKQLDLLRDFYDSTFMGSAAIGVFALWGILYFVFLIFFDLYTDYREKRLLSSL